MHVKSITVAVHDDMMRDRGIIMMVVCMLIVAIHLYGGMHIDSMHVDIRYA